MIQTLEKEVKALRDQIIGWRRDFHKHPEVAFQEHRTSQVLESFMDKLGLDVTPMAKTGLRGVLEGGLPGKVLALRADMDALPLKEEADKPYCSENPEAAHACGHDGHMAILMGVVQVLARLRDRLPGRVVFLFQPSEERIPGGAATMIAEGALEGVEGIFGLHLWQPLPTGFVGLVRGAMMAQPDQFTIRVRGRGGHGSMPHQTADPILAASHIVVNVQSIASRNVDPLKPVVVSFGTIQGGTIYNIIPGEVLLTGTVRSFEADVQALAERRLKEIAERTSRAFGAEAEIEYIKGYPPLINDDAMVTLVEDVARKVLGENRVKFIDPVMGGEDFAYYLRKVPGAFFFFGMGDGMEHPHHHPAFDLDEEALPQATLFMSSLALEFLGAGKNP